MKIVIELEVENANLTEDAAAKEKFRWLLFEASKSIMDIIQKRFDLFENIKLKNSSVSIKENQQP